jgi:Uma2 family endonuclease
MSAAIKKVRPRALPTVIHGQDVEVRIPDSVVDLESFRRWAWSPAFPDRGRIDYLAGTLWVDLTMEEFTHNQCKGAICLVLAGLVRAEDLGRFIWDRMRITNLRAGLSAEPDGAFAFWETFRSKRLRLVRNKKGSCLEFEGTPDMVLEVISDSSVVKDTEVLMELYWKAGIPEFWLVDARQDPPRFDIFKHSAKRYVAVKKQGGWLRSAVFGQEFQLIRDRDELGEPQFILNVR